MAHISQNVAAFESSSLLQSPGPAGRGIPAAVLSYEAINVKSSAIASTVDDAVSLGVKRLCTTFISCIVLWLISYVVIMLQIIEKGHFVPFTSFLFIPMWIGSLYGLVSVALIIMSVCKHGGTLISKERRLFMQALGLQLEQYIDFESLPLMRRLFFWSTVLATFLLLTLSTQVFLYLWIVAGVIGMWHAVIPLLIIFTVLFIYLILVKTMSLSACCCFALSFLGMLLYTAKCKNELGLSWRASSLPMVAVEGYLTLHCLWVMLQLGLRRLVLTWRQTFCLFGFLLSIIVAFVAEALTATRDFASPPPLHLTAALVQTIPMILWVVVGVIFTVSAVLIVEQEMSRIAHSRGYTNPIPLTRSQLGWEPALGYRECSSILLGVIKIPRPVLYPLVSSTGGPEQRQRGGVRGSVYRRDEDRGRSSRSSFGYSSPAGSRWRSTAREETQGEASSVCLDHSGIASMFCRTVQLIHRSVSNFVSKTSILQSVNNSSSVGTPTVELYSSGASHHTAIRTVSGELDGGNADF